MTKRILVVEDQAALMSGLWPVSGRNVNGRNFSGSKNGGYLVSARAFQLVSSAPMYG
jgi:hypothetical protein